MVTFSLSSDYTLDVKVNGIPDTITDSDSLLFTIAIENGTKNTLLYDMYTLAQLTDENRTINIPCKPSRLEFAIGNKVKEFGGILFITELYDSIVIDTTVLRKADTLKAIDTSGFDKKEKLRHKIEVLETFYSSKKKVTKNRSVNTGVYTLKIKLMFKDRLACQSDCRNWIEFPFAVVVKKRSNP
jgi:hypothetical protein